VAVAFLVSCVDRNQTQEGTKEDKARGLDLWGFVLLLVLGQQSCCLPRVPSL
jgi:hypothetical protein